MNAPGTLGWLMHVLGQPCPEHLAQTHITELLTDSRRLSQPARTAFFALRGDRHDGHTFIQDLYQRGVRVFVVSRTAPEGLADAVFIQVEDTLSALQTVAAARRALFSYPVIGVTGSNGKTVVKEWLHQLLEPDHRTVRSPKSYNSQIGVPLSVWRMSEAHTLGIFEAGISKPGEMLRLQRIIRPDIGVFTTLGQAHDEHFTDHHQKSKEKLDLFVDSTVIIYCRDYKVLEEEVRQYPFTNSPRIFSWSRKGMADLQVGRVAKERDSTDIQAVFRNDFISIRIPFTDEASIENAISCWAVLLHLGVDNAVIAERMALLGPVAMRLELKQGINGCSVINDSYNSDLQSISIALDFLAQQHQHPVRTIILSDILQSGQDDAVLYGEVARMVSERGISRLIGIGPRISAQAGLFGTGKEFFPSTEAFLKVFNPRHFANETVLLKGARPFGFEAIGNLLQQKSHQTVLEVDLGAMVHNLNAIRSLLAPEVKVMAMVKAFGYGSGTYEVANLLQFHRVDRLAVAYADEGVELRRAGVSLPIMVMNPEEQAFDSMIQNGLDPEVYSMRSMGALRQALDRRTADTGRVAVHIKLNTGMNRLGFNESEVDRLCALLRNGRDLQVVSVFSHLAASEDPAQDAFTRQQIQSFSQMADHIMQRLGHRVDRHILNSHGIFRFPEAQFDMVRLGIGLYGVAVNPQLQGLLRQVGTLRSTISQIHELSPGQSVGYGRMEQVKRSMRTATVPIGYADGLSRRHGNRKGHILVHGQKAPIIGSVCMDMCMIDISGIPAQEGDPVVVFGEGYPVADFARNADTIPYEVLTSISGRVKRVYFEE